VREVCEQTGSPTLETCHLMVPAARLELARLKPEDFKSSVSTIPPRGQRAENAR
jgi:hypothetical protein